MTTYPLTTLAAQVTPAGISAPSYEDIVASLQASFRSIYGSDAYLESDSQDGQWIAVLAQAINDTNLTAIAVYNAFSPATAQGNGLASVVKINGLKKLEASKSTAPVLVVGQAGTTITNGVVADETGEKWDLPPSVTIPVGGQTTVTATAQNLGALTAEVGVINVISTPTRGWQSVTNTAAATPGAPVEGDATLRRRQALSTALPSKTVLDGIRGAVTNLAGVAACAVYENDTNVTNGIGLPANSVTVVVDGGDVQEVAQAIALKKTPGTGTYGTTEATVFDEMGVPSTIKFFERTLVTVTASITIKALPGYLSTTGEAVVSTVAAYIDDLGIGAGNTAGAGKVFLWKVGAMAALMGSGLEKTFEVQSVTLGRDGGALSAADVDIAFNEMPACAETDITLTVV